MPTRRSYGGSLLTGQTSYSKITDKTTPTNNTNTMNTTLQPNTKRTVWTPDHDEILKVRFDTDYLHDIASHIGCTRSTVCRHARRLGLKKKNPSGRNRDARAFILMEYPNLAYQEMAERTGLNKHTITRIARGLGWSAQKSSSVTSAAAVARSSSRRSAVASSLVSTSEQT